MSVGANHGNYRMLVRLNSTRFYTELDSTSFILVVVI